MGQQVQHTLCVLLPIIQHAQYKGVTQLGGIATSDVNSQVQQLMRICQLQLEERTTYAPTTSSAHNLKGPHKNDKAQQEACDDMSLSRGDVFVCLISRYITWFQATKHLNAFATCLQHLCKALLG